MCIYILYHSCDQANNGQVTKASVPLFAVETPRLPTDGTFVFRMSRIRSGTGYGATTRTLYQNATLGAGELPDNWLFATTTMLQGTGGSSSNGANVDLCARIDAMYSGMVTEDERCFCNGFY
jgi:hypothetical protein